MHNKILTVSIAAYNVEKYIQKCIESLIVNDAEVNASMEIIAVDDGSTDNTSKILDMLAEEYKNVKVIHKENAGYGSTINESLKIAQGKYIKQLDGDDWFETVNIIDFVKQLQYAKSDIIITPYYNVYELNGKRELIRNNTYLDQCCDLNSTIIKEIISMHEMVFSTCFLKNINLSITERCFYTDNELVLLPYLHAQSIERIDLPIYNYRIGREGQSVSITGAKKHYKDIRRVTERLLCEVSMNSDKIPNCKRFFIDQKLFNMIAAVYSYYLVVGNKEARDELISFDRMLMEKYFIYYDLSGKSRTIKYIRESKFWLYYILGYYVGYAWK